MTREEFKVLVKAMKAVYTQPTFIPDQDAFNIWYEMLKDLDYKTASFAVKKYMQSEEKEPRVSSIRKHAQSFKKNNELNEMKAWDMVYKAICNSAWNAEEEFSKLPEILQKSVSSPSQLQEWGKMNLETVNSVVQSNFLKTYRTEVAREREAGRLSPDVKKLVYRQEAEQKIKEKSIEKLTVAEERKLSESNRVDFSRKIQEKLDILRKKFGR